MSSAVHHRAFAGLSQLSASVDGRRDMHRGLEISRVSPEHWDRLAVTFDGICQEQLACYAAGRWPRLDLEPIIYSREGRPVGGALVMIQPLPLRVAKLALVKWGPILANADMDDAEAVQRAMVEHLQAEYGDRRGMMVSIMPMVEPTAQNQGAARLRDLGFHEGERLRAPDRYIVDVRLEPEARMAAFGQKWRYHLRKALKSDLAIERGGPEDIERFMVLYRAMSERKRFADHSAIETVGDLLDLPKGLGRPELFFVTCQGRTVAGAIIFTAGRMATYLYGATSDDALDLRAGYFLHWHIIGWLRENTRATTYDLGGSDGSSGLHQFKSGMVGDGGYIHPLPPVFNYASRLKARWAGEAAYAVRGWINRTRDRVQSLVQARHGASR